MLHEYGIWIDGEFIVIAESQAPIRGPYGWAGRWERLRRWLRALAIGKAPSCGEHESA